MRIDYEARWMTNLPLETMRMLCIATQLDPRFKAWKFKVVWRDRKEQALKWLKDEYAAHWKPSHVGHPMTPQSTSSKDSKKPNKKHKSVTELLSSDEESADDVPDVRDVDFEAANDVMARDELMMYLSEPPLAKEADVLEWWRLNRAKYPSVALMARCVALASTHHTAASAPHYLAAPTPLLHLVPSSIICNATLRPLCPCNVQATSCNPSHICWGGEDLLWSWGDA
jgi:hypothetical protein